MALVRLIILLCTLPLLAGCKLLDQTSFGDKPRAPAPDLLAAALRPGSQVPLITIQYGPGSSAYTPIPLPSANVPGQIPPMMNYTYDPQVKQAIQTAEVQRPNAAYEVVTVVPAADPPAQQVAIAQAGKTDALDLVNRMVDLGVNGDKITLAVRSDPGVKVRELRVYVEAP